MSINEIRQKIKTFIGFVEKRDIYGSILIVFVALSSFSLGKLSTNKVEKIPVTVENLGAVFAVPLNTLEQEKTTPVANREVVPNAKSVVVPVNVVEKSSTNISTKVGNYVASKSGKRFYLPTCSGAKTIKEANKIWFATKDDALAAGFTPALNCNGI